MKSCVAFHSFYQFHIRFSHLKTHVSRTGFIYWSIHVTLELQHINRPMTVWFDIKRISYLKMSEANTFPISKYWKCWLCATTMNWKFHLSMLLICFWMEMLSNVCGFPQFFVCSYGMVVVHWTKNDNPNRYVEIVVVYRKDI